jgi:diguanylate cyclase (GGDEF)-like protein/PAS domain S-box-containing protein
MLIDIRTLSLIFCITTILEVLILLVQYKYQEGSSFTGFLWWIAGIALIGFNFLIIFLQRYLHLRLFAAVIENYVLVTGMFFLSHGVLLFFHGYKKSVHFFVFVGFYIVSTTIAYFFGNIAFPGAISAFSIALFSLIAAISVINEKSYLNKRLKTISAGTFIFNSLFFMVHAILWLIIPGQSSPGFPSIFQQFSYLLLFINSTIWTFAFIFLMNHKVMRETIISKEKYTLMFETIPDAVLISRLDDGLLTEVNQGFTLLSGYTASDIKGKSSLAINLWYDPVDRSRFMVILTETGSIENMEIQFRKKNGRLLIGLLSARAIDIDGVPHALTVVRDITNRKKMEEKLRENEQKYRFLTENSGDVIWHINKSLRIDYISPADEQIRGFKREEVIGTQIWSIFKPEGVQLVREKLEHHREKEEVGNNMMVSRFEIEQRCKDGSWIWTEIVAAPHYDNYGNLVGYHGISRDCSERKQLLDQLYKQATIDELTQAPNRRHFMNLAEIELRRAKRYHHPLSLVAIDFDLLKEINDTYGHMAGDRALSVFTKIVNQIIRDVDVLGRIGGDEFLLLLPETDSPGAALVMERIQDVLASSPVYIGKKNFNISVSAGIASIQDWSDTLEDLYNRADSALYESKDQGGKKITWQNLRK